MSSGRCFALLPPTAPATARLQQKTQIRTEVRKRETHPRRQLERIEEIEATNACERRWLGSRNSTTTSEPSLPLVSAAQKETQVSELVAETRAQTKGVQSMMPPLWVCAKRAGRVGPRLLTSRGTTVCPERSAAARTEFVSIVSDPVIVEPARCSPQSTTAPRSSNATARRMNDKERGLEMPLTGSNKTTPAAPSISCVPRYACSTIDTMQIGDWQVQRVRLLLRPQLLTESCSCASRSLPSPRPASRPR
jgi:hypothetical protein